MSLIGRLITLALCQLTRMLGAVAVSLTAGAQVVGAVLKRAVSSSPSCTALTRIGVIGTLTGAGIVLPSMSAPSSVISTVTCGATATGQ